jgi:hypothetical protein
VELNGVFPLFVLFLLCLFSNTQYSLVKLYEELSKLETKSATKQNVGKTGLAALAAFSRLSPLATPGLKVLGFSRLSQPDRLLRHDNGPIMHVAQFALGARRGHHCSRGLLLFARSVKIL